jgi:hypothetical protein
VVRGYCTELDGSGCACLTKHGCAVGWNDCSGVQQRNRCRQVHPMPLNKDGARDTAVHADKEGCQASMLPS